MQRYTLDLRPHRDPDPRAAGLTLELVVGSEVTFTVRISASPKTGVPLPSDAQAAADAIQGFMHAHAGMPADHTPNENRAYAAGFLTGSEGIYRADQHRRALDLKRDSQHEAE